MRFVIYDDESLEPITVLNLPLTERDIFARGMRWRVPAPHLISFASRYEHAETMGKLEVVELEFERFQRNSPRHGRQKSVMCFTRATELAMLLNPAWLPGQRSAVDYLQEQNDALTRMLMRVF